MIDALSCALCSTPIAEKALIEGERGFCCKGCQVVFQILSAKQQLDSVTENPIFQQAVRSGLISNPLLLENIRKQQISLPSDEVERLHLTIDEMWCPSCAEIIRLILLQEKGVRQCVVDYTTDFASIEFCPRYISKDQILGAIKSLGYVPVLLESKEQKAIAKGLNLRFGVAAFCALNAMMFAYPLYAIYYDGDPENYGSLFVWLSLLFSLPVVCYSAWPIYRRFLLSLQVGLYGMETLIVIGVSTAFFLSLIEMWHGGIKVYFDSLTVIIALVLLGKIIESHAKFSVKDSLIRLAHAMPKRGRKRFSDGSQQFVPLKEITLGDHLVVFAGEKIVLDGIVSEGSGACNESLMTGEARPIEKKAGSTVLGGAILEHGWIAYRVTSTPETTALHHILELVTHEIDHKTPYVRHADIIVRWFVPLVLFIALATAIVCWLMGVSDPGRSAVETSWMRALSILLISCPCAIGIAAPLAESYIIRQLAKLGAIVRNRGSLSLLGKETLFAFDKTGTLTTGMFCIQSGLENLSQDDQAVLKGLASQSNHLIARGIDRSLSLNLRSVSDIVEIAGNGLKGKSNGETYLLGSRNFMISAGIAVPHDEDLESSSVVFFAKNQQLLAKIRLGDTVRMDASAVVEAVQPSRSILLSGDTEGATAFVARACHIQKWFSGCSPQRKSELIVKLRKEGEIVAMIGDGINDAPALTAASIGISVVSATDISIQVSDILLTTDRLEVLPAMRSIAIKGRRIIRQNLFWAFFYNIVGIGLATAGLLNPLFAAFAMTASSIIVVFNAKRLSSH